jgi:hypothetical protein
MLQIIALILLCYLAIQTTWSIHNCAAVFSELRASRAAQWLVWLYPLPFALPLLNRSFWHLFFPFPVGVLFFAPGIIAARKALAAVDRSGHPKAKLAGSSLERMVTFGIMGMFGVCILSSRLWLHRRSGSSF